MGAKWGMRGKPEVWKEALYTLSDLKEKKGTLLLQDAIFQLSEKYGKSKSWSRRVIDHLRDFGKIETSKLSSGDLRVRIDAIITDILPQEVEMFDFDRKIESLVSEKAVMEKELDFYRKNAELCRQKINKITKDIENSMLENGVVDTISGSYHLKIKKRPASVIIEDESLLPEEAFKTIKEPSKSQIKKLIQNGVSIKGAKLESLGEYVFISFAE